MALKIQNTASLTTNGSFRFKGLIYGPAGMGKSLFCSTAPNPIVLACETGHGGGLLSVSGAGIDYIVPETYSDMELFCSGHGLEKYDTLVIDGFSYAADTIIKNHALTVPRRGGESAKRAMGVMELDDYGTLAELTRKLLARLLQNDKNILVTCLMDFYQPPQGGQDPKPEKIGGPDMSGSMRLGSSAMFDIVLKLHTRPALRNPKDPSSRYYQRYFLCDTDGKYLAKSRLRNGNKSLFPTEVPFDLETGEGSFQYFYDLATKQVSKT
jgi:hypothetical protein